MITYLQGKASMDLMKPLRRRMPMSQLERGFDFDDACKLYLPFYRQKSTSAYIYDQSGNNNHATIIGAVPTTLASPPIGWYCDGTDDRITLSNVFTTNQTGLVVLSWVYCHSFDQNVGVAKRDVIINNYGSNQGYQLCANHSGANQTTWQFRIHDGTSEVSLDAGYSADATFTTAWTNKWLCICSSFEASARMKFWINGSGAVADKTAGVPAQMTPNTVASDYIAYYSAAVVYSNFTFAEIAIFNRPFSDTELRNYYETTRRKYGV